MEIALTGGHWCGPDGGHRLNKWFEWVKANDATFTKVYDEVAGALKGWEDSGRWDTIHLAGYCPQLFVDCIASFLRGLF
jgi:hypothetical protein